MGLISLFLDPKKEVKRKVTSPKSLQVVQIMWRIKKNRRNGEVIHLTRDDDIPQLCPFQADFRIVSRENKLGQKLELPLGIFLDEYQKEFSYLTCAKISEYFKFIVKEVHELVDPLELLNYSAHSLRVTAALLLHQAQKDPEYIKIRLRWVSNAFQEYL